MDEREKGAQLWCGVGIHNENKIGHQQLREYLKTGR